MGPARHRTERRHGPLRRVWLAWIAVALLATGTAAVVINMQHQPLFVDDFSGSDGLVTNEFAYFNAGNPAAVRSPLWTVTSGSLFVHDNAGWTGVPDRRLTGPTSASGTDSSVFRAVTRNTGFQNVAVSFGLLVQRFVADSSGQSPTWRGVHVFLRYQTPDLLYVVSVDRGDGVVVIKKKVPGGSPDGGTYYTLATVRGRSVVGRWEQVRVSAVNDGAGVQFSVWLDNRLRLKAVDNGAGDVPPITQPGRVGIRGDYAEFEFDNFTVSKA